MLKFIFMAAAMALPGENHVRPTKSPTLSVVENYARLAAVGTTITGKITGGPNAGSFLATSVDPTCSMGLTGPKSFGNQYSVSGKADNEFSSLQLIVDDYEAAKKGTDKFYVKVAFWQKTHGQKIRDQWKRQLHGRQEAGKWKTHN